VFNSDVLDDVEDTFEARANYLALQGEHVEALINARGWLRDQPFARDPALFGSYRAALIKDYAAAISFARAGLRANPHDYMLQNNLIFALASSGDVETARQQLPLLEEATRGKTLDGEWDVVLDATKGLIAFRGGDTASGRATYLDVIRRAKEPSLKAMALIMWAREEITARTVQATEALEMARSATERVAGVGTPRAVDLPSWLDHLSQD
jgi:tetratricopeptide (TPR) repeat protein